MSSALLAVPDIPCDAQGPVFGAPWQAQAVAMAVALRAKGVFSWPEWAQVFGEHIRCAPAEPGEDAGNAYYRQWLAALEDIVARKGAASAPELDRWQHAWEHAADRRSHAARAANRGARPRTSPSASRQPASVLECQLLLDRLIASISSLRAASASADAS